jgi:glycosyltransferase involved in cell wall biosynthesis
MSKRKILFVTEANFHPTGYSMYTREVLSRLHKNPDFEIAELACFIGPESEEAKQTPWKIYPNMPPSDNTEAMNVYNSSMSNKFGEFSFNSVLLDFKPDIVMDIRDPWMCCRINTTIAKKSTVDKIQDIKVGDIVLTHTGDYRKVTNTFKRNYSGKMYGIKSSHIPFTVWLTDNHPVLASRIKNRSLKTKETDIQWINSQDVTKDHFVFYPIEKFTGTLHDPDFLRLIGYYTAEGCLMYEGKKEEGRLKGVQISFHSKETEYVNDVTALIKKFYGIDAKVKTKTGTNSCNIRAFGRKIAEDMKRLSGELAGEKIWSDEIFDYDQESLRHLLCGLFRGDGGFNEKQKRGYYCTKSEQLAYQVFRLCLRFGISPSFNLNNNSIGVKTYQRYIFGFAKESFYGFKSVVELSTESPASKRIQHGYLTLKVKDIQVEDTSETVYNFEVEGDNSYVSSFALHNCEFEERSPFREFFHMAWMPTVDAEPQNPAWLESFSNADAVFGYTEFGRDTMLGQNKHIKFIDVAPPCAGDSFYPMDKKAVRAKFGLTEDAIIFGTVMRNQRRKLFPDLFKAFRLFIDQNPDLKNVYLYCHTGFPDVGWDIPALIIENGLSSRVLLTYKCRHCGNISPSFFGDAVKVCKKCGNLSNQIVGIGNKINDDELNEIYNIFDAYIQWANSEGAGISQMEAAKIGIPIISVKYSGMDSIVSNLQGVGIKPIGFYKELETGCNRAVPNNIELAEWISKLSRDKALREEIGQRCYSKSKEIYSWDKTAKVWADHFYTVELKDPAKTWNSPPRIFTPANGIPEGLNSLPISDQVSWLFQNVLGKPEWINKSMWRKMVKDLTYRMSMSSMIPGYYYNDFSHPDIERTYEPFDLQKAYAVCRGMRDGMNQWESLRIKKNEN